MASSRERRTYTARMGRRRLTEQCYVRMDITLPPRLFEKLKPHLEKQYWQPGHYGYCLVKFLESLELE
jgi:hypothetical protein